MFYRESYIDEEELDEEYDSVEYENESYDNFKKTSVIEVIKNIFSKEIIIILFLSILCSLVSFGNIIGIDGNIREIQPFAYALIGAISIYGLPLFAYFLTMIVTTFIGVGVLAGFKYLSFSIIFILSSAFVNIVGMDKKISTFIKLILSSIITEIIFILVRVFVVKEFIVTYDIFISIYQVIAIAIFYPIFTNAIYTIKNYTKKIVFSKEEIIATSIFVAICFSGFGDISILNVSIRNILGILVILLVGFENGILVGSVSGTLIGLILAITSVNSGDSSLIVSTYALSGLLSGLFNKYGKLGVICGFIIGNATLAYIFNGSTEITIRIIEIIVASVALLAIPNKYTKKLEGLFDKNLTLAETNTSSNIKEEVVFKLNAVSNIFEELSDTFVQNTFLNEEVDVTKQKLSDIINNISREICKSCENNEKCWKEDEEETYREIFNILEKLLNNEDIEAESLNISCTDKRKVIDKIKDLILQYKLEEIYIKQEKQNKKNILEQFKGVSKVISDIAQEISNKDNDSDNRNIVKEELHLNGFNAYDIKFKKEKENIVQVSILTDIFNDIDRDKREIENILTKVLEKKFITKLIINSSKTERSRIKLIIKPNLDFKIGISTQIKDKSSLSGDSYAIVDLEDGKHLIALSDGMGSGNMAEYNSRSTINLLKKLLATGFDKDNALSIINSVMLLKNNSNSFATIDLSIINTQSESVEFLKIGASPTYIKKGNDDIRIVESDCLPAGVLPNCEFKVHTKKIDSGDFIIMLTDGAHDIEECGVIKQNWIEEFLKEEESQNPQKIADNLIEKAKSMSDGNVKDDMTVIVIQII